LLTGLLRKELHFDGLIITDDMRMNGALLFSGGLAEAYRLAIEAGNDIIISSTTAQLGEALWQQNLDLIKTSPEFRAQVTASARRILYAKLVYFKGNGYISDPVPIFPDMDKLPSLVPDREGEAFFLGLACRSITLAKKGGSFPYPPTTSGRVLLAGQYPAYYTAGNKRYPNADIFRFETSDIEENTLIAIRLAETAVPYDTVILCVADEDDARIARVLRYTGKRVIIISVMSPVPSFNLEWADTVLYTYSTSPSSFEAAFGALVGEFTPRGILPIRK
jgi:beta-N-acetylhexosaminidase